MTESDPAAEVVAGIPIAPPDALAPPAPTDAVAPKAAGVWAIRDFRIVALGEGISAVGDAVSFIALPLLVLALTGSGTVMGLIAALQTLPDLLLGLPAGALADRWDRRRMLILADAGRAVLTALIPLSVVLGLPTMLIIGLVVFPINALRVLFMAAWTGAVPNLVGRSLIGPATSYLEAIFSLGFILGPALAGILSSIIGPGPTLAIDAGSFVVSAAALLLVRTPLQASDAPREEQHILADIRDGIRFLAGHAGLRAAVAFWGAVGIATAGLIPALTFFIQVDQGLKPDALGLVISTYSIGSVGGALIASRLTRGRLGPLLLVGNAITGSLIVVLTLAGGPLQMAILSFVAGIAQSIVLVSYVTIRASSTPDQLLGRVGATARTISIGMQPIGAAVAGVLLDQVAGGATLRIMGAALLLVSLGFLFSPALRGARAGKA